MSLPLLMAIAVIIAALPVGADETEVLFDGTGPAEWNTQRDSARLEREFSLSELAQAADPPALQWRFVSRGVGFNDIFLMKPITRPFGRFRVLVRNEGAPVTLACKVRDDSRAEWTANRVPVEPGDWRWVEFPREEWRVASWSSDPDGELTFPLAYFTLIAFDVQAGAEYHLKVARVEVVRPTPPVATVHELEMPAVLRAGETYRTTLRFSLDRPCEWPGAALWFRREGRDLFSLPLPLPAPLPEIGAGEMVDIRDMPLQVPLYAAGGRMGIALQLGEARIEYQGRNADQEVIAVTVEARRPGHTVAEVKRHNGVPALFINGALHDGMAWATYGPSREVFSDFTEAGVSLFTFSGTPTEAGYGLSQTTWVAPDAYDYTQFDQRVLMLLEANPEAYFFPRLYLHAPPWWSEQHPDDIVLMDPGDGNPVPLVHSGGKPAPSWASEAWRRDTVEGLRRMVAHIEASPYADRVVGYHIASGTTEEWMMWGANENEWVDYSPVNVARFRGWLRDRYGTVESLREAWGDDAVTFETALIPTKSQRQATELGALRDPAQERAVIDFYLYNSDLVADTICHFARAMKDIAGRDKVVGFFYGYLLQLCGEQRQQNAGHLALEKVLACPDVDFLTSPTSYAFRALGGEGTCHFMSLYASVALHGKLWFNENDVRTSLSGGNVGEWGRAADVAGDIIQQDKELAHALTVGAAQWWFDVGRNRYDHPELMARIAHLTQAAGQAQSLDRAPVDEVAMVVDESSLAYLRVGDRLGTWLLLAQLPALHRIGAPVGHYLASDLPRIADRKVFLFMTGFAPSEADRREIDALKRDGNVLVFLWAPGIYRDGRLDEDGMRDLTGIRLRMSEEPTELRVTLSGGHAITDGLQGQTYGVGQQTFPVVFADDPQATVVGTLPDGRPGLVVKEQGDWTAIHSAAPMLPAGILRRISTHAGVHEYIETEDVVWASRDLVAVSVREAGTRLVRLPRRANVRDLYTGEELAREAEAFEADFGDRATRIFALEGP